MAHTRKDIVELVDQAYDLEGNNEQWLGRVVASIDELAGGTGRSVGFTFDTEAPPGAWVREVGGVGVSATELSFVRAAYRRPTLMRALASVLGPPDTMPPVTLLSSILARVPFLTRIFTPFVNRFGFADLVALAANDGSRSGIIVNLPIGRERGQVDSRGEAARLRSVRSALPHIAAGHRLRRTLAAAELVLAPDGTVKDGEVSADLRERLRAAVQVRDRAHTRAGRADPDAALAAWAALVEGRWTLIDRFERSGTRFVVAIPNLADVAHPRRLAPLERAVLALLMRGRSNKAIGYELGLAPGTVGAYISTIRKKLGPLLDEATAGRPASRFARHTVGEVELLTLTRFVDGDDLRRARPLAALPPAEREVARLALAGLTNADIACTRGVSERTVANQLASIYRRLEVGSRRELAAWFATHDPDE